MLELENAKCHWMPWKIHGDMLVDFAWLLCKSVLAFASEMVVQDKLLQAVEYLQVQGTLQFYPERSCPDGCHW